MKKLQRFAENVMFTLMSFYSLIAGPINMLYHKIRGTYRR